MTQEKTKTLSELLEPYAQMCEADMERWLVDPCAPATLAQAMRYCVLGGGKRLRPALVMLAAQAVGGNFENEMARRSAVAVEMIHCYSLVHDDLPAMDDDVLRRGQPTAHVKFGEAMAILAGDALLTRAFGVLSAPLQSPGGIQVADVAAQVGRLVGELALGAGECGMIAGQVADMDLCSIPDGEEGLRYIHSRKTGALIRASVRMGAICGNADAGQLAAVSAFGDHLGLVFQLVDDLLDGTGEAATLGKTPGKDAQSGKRTYLSQLGLEGAKELAAALTQKATMALEPLGEQAQRLTRLAQLLALRTH